MINEHYRIKVARDRLVFCSGHFISYEGDKCERLHGHNYRAAVEISGMLDANYYLFDFVALTRMAKAITDELDHHMLLATRNAVIRIEEAADVVRVACRNRHWVFPREDCVLLPIENSTAELLARYIGQRLLGILKAEHDFIPGSMRVEVEENVGQSATYSWNEPQNEAVG
jgi:6-pyruvoyltetrahydropterin/6-carboxytetrahydropterin synthase